MRDRYIKLFATCCLFITSSAYYVGAQQQANSRLATASFVLRVPDNNRNELVHRLTALGNSKGLSVHVSRLRDTFHLFIDMTGQDIDIVASNPFPDTIEFQIFIYKNRDNVPAAVIEDAVNDVTRIVDGIDGVIIDAIKR
jgi:Fe2+ transport system protein FeoA